MSNATAQRSSCSDLRGLDYLDSTALHAFHGARSRADANGHQLIIIGVGSRARRLFELTGTEFLLDDRYAATVIDQNNGTAVPAAAQTTAGLVDADG